MRKNYTAKRETAGNPYAYTVLQNLKDAGFTDEMVEKFMDLQDSEDEEQQIQLLSGHRKHLLEKLHREEKRIDCLDYLLYQMNQKAVLLLRMKLHLLPNPYHLWNQKHLNRIPFRKTPKNQFPAQHRNWGTRKANRLRRKTAKCR